MARAAHCIGCGVTFPKMHLMINHRRTNRCGGRFLPADERELYSSAKTHSELALKAETEKELEFHLDQAKAMLALAWEKRAKRG